MKKIKWLFVFIVALPYGLFLQAQESPDKELELLIEKFNQETVPYILPEELKRDYGKYIILDTRLKKEYDVSHLPGALWVGETFESTDVSKLNNSQPIVVYCTVGVRSEDYGEQLQASGFTVYNLYGSIFSWKNGGYLVVDNDGEPTQSIHVYDEKWGKYLKSGIKVY